MQQDINHPRTRNSKKEEVSVNVDNTEINITCGKGKAYLYSKPRTGYGMPPASLYDKNRGTNRWEVII